jgi:dihydroorotase
MQVLIRKAAILDPLSPFNGQTKDIVVDAGVITAIGDAIELPEATVVTAENMLVSPGWVDIFAHFCDPGFEYRETLQSGAAAAAAGGFTTVFALPNTQPVVANKTAVEYVVQQSKQLPVTILPIGAVTKNCEGKELAEMYDMKASGAAAFSDGLHPVQSAGLLLKALQYVKPFNGVVLQIPDDTSIAPHGLMNEGIVSTQLGLPGKPIMAEEIMVARDIKLARYTNSSLHFTGITSPKSVEYIKRAKASGLQITCSVTPYHLFFCDEDLKQYDTNLKVNLPLRTAEDRAALRAAVADGTIDCIASHHLPQNTDQKNCEFEYAKNGMIGLQTVFAVINSIFPQLTNEHLMQIMGLNARSIFGLAETKIAVGATASLTLFDRTSAFTLTKPMIKSKSHNTAFTDIPLQGKVIGTVHNNQLTLNH